MSTKGIRNFRPNVHFTPPSMWMNDPNGMVYVNGTYHLFYQHYPLDTIWGPMHWGHATSADLIHWEHQPIALYPDELGSIFSGSCVFDKDNCSGLGTKEKPPIVAMFTSHGECEQQSIAYSTDGIHFEKHYGNPVIPNPGITDFRDPKLFWNPVKNCWSLVLAAKDRVHFYSSFNLKDWKKTGEFGPEGNHCSGVWECPDLFPLDTAEGTKWVLLVSMSSIIEYFIGDFDGETFICTEPFGKPVLIDQGFDNYAGVTFQNCDDRIFMGWAINCGYASDTPTNEYCGQMTLPRLLSLVKTSIGYRLASNPVGLCDAKSTAIQIGNEFALSTETFGLTVYGESTGSITFKNLQGQELIIGIDENNQLYVDRTNAGTKNFNEQFSSEQYCKALTPRYEEGAYELDIIFDVSIIEVFADKGLNNMTLCVYPDSPYISISLEGNIKAKIYPIG